MLGSLWLSGALMALVVVVCGLSWVTRIDVRPGLLICGGSHFEFEEIRALALVGRVFAIEAVRGGKVLRRRVSVPPGTSPNELRAALARRGLELGGNLPPWARNGRLYVRVSALLLASSLVGISPALWALSQPATTEETLTDSFDQSVLLISEASLSGLTLTHVVLLPSGKQARVLGSRGAYGRFEINGPGHGADFEIDLTEGRWRDEVTRLEGALTPVLCAHEVEDDPGLRLDTLPNPEAFLQAVERAQKEERLSWTSSSRPPPQAGRTLGRSLPATLEALGEPAAGAEGFLHGRSSSRFYDLRGGGKAGSDIVAAVDQGRVLWLVEVPKGAGWTLLGANFGYA